MEILEDSEDVAVSELEDEAVEVLVKEIQSRNSIRTNTVRIAQDRVMI